ncbi:MAG: hypothetical protein II789_07855, partial [Clostridia bacterium]|nr:hypothetical protein [Clostridia bacterium]
MNEQLQQIDKHALMEEIGANSLIEKKWDDIMTSDSICYSLTDISTLGAEFSSLLTVFSELGKAAGSNGTLYEATFPVAGKL